MKRRSRTLRHRQLLRLEKRLGKSGYGLIAGVDEAGRGPLAGPVVAGAVILRGFEFDHRIDDSKKLSAAARLSAYEEIIDKAFVGVGIVGRITIDRVNIYRATLMAMERAVSSLPVPPEYIIVDGNMRFPAECPLEPVVRGDCRSISIAAASIVAKVTRDNIMLKYDAEFPQYGFCHHKGYATLAHRRAIKKHGLSPIHRRSFSFDRDSI